MVSDWTLLITGEKSFRQIILELMVHQYVLVNDIRLQNEKWTRSSFITDSIYNVLKKSTPTHSSLDNNNFITEFQTGHGSAHHTSQLLFQSRYAGM